jgi:alpha-galactosidase
MMIHIARIAEAAAMDPDTFLEGAFVPDGSRVSIASLWNGQPCLRERSFLCYLGWNDTELFVRFSAAQHEPLVVTPKPGLKSKAIGLWERDVCEIFIAPDRNQPSKYFEFEVAPTGEWLDLAIDMTSGERVADFEYNSGMEAAARVEEGGVVMAMKIPWEAFGGKPKLGDVWLGNIFRCVGSEPNRGYLAWSPTMTEKPNFHVPERFGQLIFDN